MPYLFIGKSADAGVLDGMPEPEALPAWLTEADLECYTNADGTGLQTWFTSRINVGPPDWSPDGSQIAFIRRTGINRNPQVFRMDASGGTVAQLTGQSPEQVNWYNLGPNW